MLKIAEQAQVPTFVFNAGLLEKDRVCFGGPRQRFKYWIGQMLPNDFQAGYDLANILVDKALKANRVAPNGRVQVVAMGGPEKDFAAVERKRGFELAMARRKDVEVLQFVPAHWLQDRARRKTSLLLRRYPDVGVIWAASDSMAVGAIDAMRGLGRKPGKDIIVGGIDWIPRALSEIRAGTMAVSFGGHFMQGGWAMVLLHDYHHGIDFAADRIDWRTKMSPVTRANMGDVARSRRNLARIDFRAFSKKYHPEMTRYSFSLEALGFAQGGSAKQVAADALRP